MRVTQKMQNDLPDGNENIKKKDYVFNSLGLSTEPEEMSNYRILWVPFVLPISDNLLLQKVSRLRKIDKYLYPALWLLDILAGKREELKQELSELQIKESEGLTEEEINKKLEELQIQMQEYAQIRKTLREKQELIEETEE